MRFDCTVYMYNWCAELFISILFSCYQVTLSNRILQVDVWIVDDKNIESMLVRQKTNNLISTVLLYVKINNGQTSCRSFPPLVKLKSYNLVFCFICRVNVRST